MIQCYIDGHVAIPSLASDIKLTRENPYIKSKDSYTFDITFPMDIAENRLVFGPVNRIGTSKRRRKYDDCILTADNVTVIRGVGTVTSVTRSELKLQILAGSSSLRYRSDFEGIFIDRISYPQVAGKYLQNAVRRNYKVRNVIDVDSEVRNKNYIGDIQTAVFMPTWDASNSCMANEIVVMGIPEDWRTEDGVTYGLVNRAVQPNLMMVLRTVMQHMGYTVKENAYDVSPWNELVICSARRTAIIAKALPHWSAARFLDEFRKLFNAVFLFDDNDKTVRVLRADSVEQSQTVSYEVEDEFQSNYDEDGLEYLGLSNIRYKLSGLSDDEVEVPDDVVGNFDIQEYDSHSAMATAFDNMTEEQKLTTLMVEPRGYFYGSDEVDASGAKTGNIVLKDFGAFTKLIRDSTTGNDVELSICPVAFARQEYLIHAFHLISHTHIDVKAVLPTIENVDVLPEDDEDVQSTEDTEERPYVTIEDVVEAGISSRREQEEEETTMQLMWVARFSCYPVNGINVLGIRLPACGNDFHSTPAPINMTMRLSHAGNYPFVGQFHGRSLHINCGGSIDGNDEQCIRFLCDGIPDPAKIYVFDSKRYLCSKIEVQITAEGIDRLKTGYFYEMLE